MTEQEAIKELEFLYHNGKGDREATHRIADGILLTFLESNGFKEIAAFYIATRDEIGFWYA